MGTLAVRKIKPPAKPADEVFIRRLDRFQEAALWCYVPWVSQRIREFCARYDTDTDGEALAREFEQHFTAPEAFMTALIAVREFHLVGHLLAQIEKDRGGRRFCNILQLEIDHGIAIPRQDLANGLHDLELWAGARMAEYMMLDAINPKVERLFRRFYGFKTQRIRMRREF